MVVRFTARVVYNKLPQARKNFPHACERIIREQVIQTTADAQENVVKYDAIDTGFMLNAIFGRMTGDFEGEVISPAHYSGYVNFGTVFMAARPFFTDAREKCAKELPQRFANLEHYL